MLILLRPGHQNIIKRKNHTIVSDILRREFEEPYRILLFMHLKQHENVVEKRVEKLTFSSFVNFPFYKEEHSTF